jgi:hypothetical protein
MGTTEEASWRHRCACSYEAHVMGWQSSDRWEGGADSEAPAPTKAPSEAMCTPKKGEKGGHISLGEVRKMRAWRARCGVGELGSWTNSQTEEVASRTALSI